MKTVAKIIQNHGGLSWLKQNGNYIRIENEPYMRLVIEHIGERRGVDLISVAHYGEQNGDAMRDPEMVFAVSPDLAHWVPTYFLNDYVGIEQEASGENEDGQLWVKMKLVKELKSFAATWDRNIREQGFLQKSDQSVGFVE